MNVALSETFVTALARLDAGDAKRTAAFLDKLLHHPEASGLQPEIVHDARSRAIRSLRVSADIRAIVHVDGDAWTLLYVARHDEAYAWVRDRCIECHPVTGELQIYLEPTDAERELAERRAVEDASYIAAGAARPSGLFDAVGDEQLLAIGVPSAWLPTVRMIYSEDMLVALAQDLPSRVADRLLDLAVSSGGLDRGWSV